MIINGMKIIIMILIILVLIHRLLQISIIIIIKIKNINHQMFKLNNNRQMTTKRLNKKTIRQCLIIYLKLEKIFAILKVAYRLKLTLYLSDHDLFFGKHYLKYFLSHQIFKNGKNNQILKDLNILKILKNIQILSFTIKNLKKKIIHLKMKI